MPSTGLLTTDDLDEIGCAAFEADQPLGVAAELVDAVERGLVADQSDTGYALIMAAEITAREGDLREAQVLAERAVAAYRARADQTTAIRERSMPSCCCGLAVRMRRWPS